MRNLRPAPKYNVDVLGLHTTQYSLVGSFSPVTHSLSTKAHERAYHLFLGAVLSVLIPPEGMPDPTLFTGPVSTGDGVIGFVAKSRLQHRLVQTNCQDVQARGR